MTNREWLLNKMQNMSDEELARKIERLYKDCDMTIQDWLKSEHKEKPKLSEVERVILENVDKKYKWLCRDKDNILCLFSGKPLKLGTYWTSKDTFLYTRLRAFEHKFQFIKWEDEQAYEISELLEGE